MAMPLFSTELWFFQMSNPCSVPVEGSDLYKPVNSRSAPIPHFHWYWSGVRGTWCLNIECIVHVWEWILQVGGWTQPSGITKHPGWKRKSQGIEKYRGDPGERRAQEIITFKDKSMEIIQTEQWRKKELQWQQWQRPSRSVGTLQKGLISKSSES